jgi:hypothetical protein
LSRVWNSTIARIIIPDEMGLNVSYNLAPVGFGFGVSLKVVVITRGKDAGTIRLLGSGSARGGFDIGGSITEERGWFYGDERDATLVGLLGSGYLEVTHCRRPGKNFS